jgi:SAM-dependent methyltransferase
MNMEALFTLHRDLPREGPGSDEATRAAIRRLRPLPRSPRVLDLGCGPGKQTLVLARELRTKILAVDFHQPYLEQLRASAAQEGLSDLIGPRLGDMESLEDEPGSVDLIWSEGAIYIVGFGRGLRLWRPILKDLGMIVASEATWLTDDPPQEVLAFWKQEYPGMCTVEDNIRIANEAGYEVFDHFVLPQSAWWDEYYDPLAKRSEMLRSDAGSNPDLQVVLDETDVEMDMCRRFGDCYGYVFYLMQKTI